MTEPELRVVIVGFGRAGLIHAKAYAALRDTCTVAAVVERNAGVLRHIGEMVPGARVFWTLDEALGELGNDLVVDFCVPAMLNLELVEKALNHGVHRFLIEKPLGWDVHSALTMASRLSGCEAIYLDTYQASQGIQQLRRQIRQKGSPPRLVKVHFHKNRVDDSRVKRGFVHDAVPNAWMIEGPHMLSIARQISGEISHAGDVSTFDMEIDGEHALPEHGGGRATLEHVSGAQTLLDLNMCSELNQRRIEVELQNGAHITLDLPPSKSTEQVSRLETQSAEGDRDVQCFEDRPMEQCVQNAMRHLGGESVPVSRLEDGLAVCAMVEHMTEKKQFWQSAPSKWKYFGPPLRPCPEDIGIMEEQVTRWRNRSARTGCRVLLCGVTPEIVEMDWPEGTRLWAVERSRAMIEEVWPARNSPTKQPLQGEWTRLPFQPQSFDLVVGDGCLTSLAYPARQREYLESIKEVLKPDGLLIMRYFVQPEERERPEAVFRDLAEDRIGSFHAFKWRLAMSLQDSSREGVRVDTIWNAWDNAAVQTPWPRQTVDTIDTYRGSDHCLTFTTLREIRDLYRPHFEEVEFRMPEYELGERCPILVHAPRARSI